jgi:hypothetical protein
MNIKLLLGLIIFNVCFSYSQTTFKVEDDVSYPDLRVKIGDDVSYPDIRIKIGSDISYEDFTVGITLAIALLPAINHHTEYENDTLRELFDDN